VKLTRREMDALRQKGLLADLRNMAKNQKRLYHQNSKIILNTWHSMLKLLNEYKRKYKTLGFPPPGENDYNPDEFDNLKTWFH